MPTTIQCPKGLLQLDLSGKVALIPGGYSDIGLNTAKQLFRQNARVIVAGRDEKKGTLVASETGFDFMAVDHSDVDSGKAFASSLFEEVDRLDVPMCNAAVMAPGAPDAMPVSARTKEG